MGYIASMAKPMHHSPYPSFNKAMSLVKRLGVRPTTEVVKTLEVAEVEKARDPRPAKRSRPNPPEPRGNAQGQSTTAKGKEKAKDDEVVSLYSEDEEMADLTHDNEQLDHGDFETKDYNQDGELADLAGIYNDYWQVQTTHTGNGANKPPQQLNSCSTNIKYISCSCFHECDCEPTKEWILDSGASLHFTNDLQDFVEYEKLKEVKIVKTANSTAHIIGKGTIILVLATGEIVRLYPVCQGHSHPVASSA